jgi:HK97 family phage major capsid protein
MTDTRTRELLIERAESDDNAFPVVLSTETPVLRHFGYEVLSHAPEDVDISRAPLPAIEGHDTSRLNIGIVEELRLTGGKLRGLLRLGKSARAAEVAADIRAGIVRNVSIGYQVGSPTRIADKDGHPVFRFPFAPHELSLVAAPADPQSGIFRSQSMQTTQNKTDDRAQVRDDELARVRGIRKMGESFGLEGQAEEAITRGTPIEEFRSVVIGHLDAVKRVPTPEYAPVDFRAPQRGNFDGVSLSRAIAAAIDHTFADGRHDLGMLKEYARSIGKTDSRGIVVPGEVLYRAVTKAGTGGNIVPTDFLDGEFIEPLRAALITGRAGATMLSGLSGDVAIPRQTADVSTSWVLADSSGQVSSSDPTFDKVTMSPKTVGVTTTASRKMILQGLPAIENIIRTSMTEAIARAIDTAALHGTGASNQPTGIFATSGIGALTTGASVAPSFSKIVDVENELLVDNVDPAGATYVVGAAWATAMRKVEVSTNTGIFLLNTDTNGEARLYGRRCLLSNLVTTKMLVLGDFRHLLIGLWSGVDIVVDPYTRASYGDVVLTGLQDVDIAVRQASAFCKLTET